MTVESAILARGGHSGGSTVTLDLENDLSRDCDFPHDEEATFPMIMAFSSRFEIPNWIGHSYARVLQMSTERIRELDRSRKSTCDSSE